MTDQVVDRLIALTWRPYILFMSDGVSKQSIKHVSECSGSLMHDT
jgi:hypothetical protein